VAICAYNRTDTLRESLQSVLNQTYKDMRIVVIDDCSTKDIKSVVDSFGDDRLEYIRNEKNLGLVDNWNRAFDICGTEFLNIFHDDDRMFPWMIEKLVAAFENDASAALVLSSRFHELGHSSVECPEGTPGRHFEKNEFIFWLCEKGGNPIVCPSAMFRKAAMDEGDMRFRPEVGLAADVYFWLEASNRGLPMYVLNFPVLEYRLHPGSCTNTGGAEKWSFTHKMLDDFISSLRLGCDMRLLRENFAKAGIKYAVLSMGEDFGIGLVNEVRGKLRDEMGWETSDGAVNKIVSVNYLKESFVSAAEGRTGFGEYRERRANLRRKGFRLPFGKQAEWFYKYVVIPKISGKPRA
jgi:glycosyltransferase involved in cell wall biosynthesis